jgi:imidazolonepropionase-like amidohydrolase
MSRLIPCFAALLLFALSFSAATLLAQQTFPTNPYTGQIESRSRCYALTNARIVVSPTQTLDKATLVVRGGMIESVGAGVSIPADAVVIDFAGKTITSSFIDLDSDYGMPVAPPAQTGQRMRRGGIELPQLETNTKGAYNWNQAIKSEYNAAQSFAADAAKADEMRKLGFGAVLTYSHDGIARGTAVLVSLADGKENLLVLKENAAAAYSMNKGTSQQDFPNSIMGIVALLRQTHLDAQWYKQVKSASTGKTEVNLSLEAWNEAASLPQIMDAGTRHNTLRADRIGDEFGVKYILRGTGDEYQALEEMKATGAAFILPLNFPAAYNVDDPLAALNLPLALLKHWEMAPANPAMLDKAGVQFALTTAALKAKQEFTTNLQTALKHGLSKQAALAAFTTVPAKLLNIGDKLGTLEKGKIANFIVTSGDALDKDAIIFQNWVQGKPYELASPDNADVRGTYTLNVEAAPQPLSYTMTVKGTIAALQGELVKTGDTVKIPLTLDRSANAIALRFATSTKATIDVRLTGWVDAKPAADGIALNWSGKGQSDDGNWVAWSARRTKLFTPDVQKPDTTNPLADMGARLYPFGDFGVKMLPKQEAVLLKNATVWTCEKDGILKNADVLLRGGKIAAVGKNLSAGDAKVMDVTGKHVTPGIIDEHSHIALHGVNEASQSNTGEVRMSDAINPDDINIYRQLAGGVTTSHLLHGSANAIGGQTTLVKLRWGLSGEAMRFVGADGFIKFALGENVKQANWGDLNTVRFPQTRMGVEQVMVDAFTRAREYEAVWKAYNALSAKDKASQGSQNLPRRDLELDAMVEILNKQRFITCHSYVQSEIAMLMRVAEQFGFTVNTFTHILEGYKVADRMKEHGANASSFSDWWAYKFEVAEAIPYNGAIMHAMGLNVAFNSDDAEMARRLNQEAAKAVKYGGVPEEEALKFVTLNPAKMLHIDTRTGSLKVGKDADVVVWSDNPLSIYARAERTFVDGIAYYDIERDQQLRNDIHRERTGLIAKMIKAKRSGAPAQAIPPARPRNSYYNCMSENEDTVR